MRNHILNKNILNKRKQRKVLEFLDRGKPGDLLNFLEENKIDIDARMPDGETIFTLAFKKDNPIAVALLSKNPNSDANPVNNDKTYLISAIKQARFGVVSLLLEKKDLKINVNMRDKFGKTALMHAVRQRTAEEFYNRRFPPEEKSNIIKLLLDRKDINPNVVDNDGKTALMYAIENKDLNIINLFLDRRNVDPNVVDNNGKTALMYLIEERKWKRREQKTSKSLNKGAEINARDKERRTVLSYAVKNKDRVMTTILLNGKNIAATAADKNVKTILTYGIEKGNEDHQEYRETDEYLIDCLLNKGAKINARDKDGNTALMYAVKIEDLDIVENLLKRKNIDPNVVDKNGKTALMYAIENKNYDIVDFLLDGKNIDPNVIDKNGKTALMYAIEKINEGDQENRETDGCLLDWLLNKGAKINVRDKNGKTALMHAIENKDFNTANLLLDRGNINLNVADKNGKTALMYAIEKRIKDSKDLKKMNIIIGRLLDKGVKINARGKERKTALMYAVENKNPVIVENLLNKENIDLNVADKNGKTALMYAIENKDCNIVYLLSNKENIDLNVADKNGKTALMYAIEKRIENPDLEEMSTILIGRFLDKGAKVNGRDKEGKTALIHAIENKDIDIVNILLNKENIELNVVDKNGKTALMHLIENKYLNITDLLSNRENIAINVVDKNGKTALMYAIEKEDHDVVNILLNREDIKLNMVDKNGKTALMHLIENKYLKITDLLSNKENIDLNVADETGKTALMYAVKNGDYEVVEFILDRKNIDPDVADKNGKTALNYALVSKDDKIAEYIFKKREEYKKSIGRPSGSLFDISDIEKIKKSRAIEVGNNSEKAILSALCLIQANETGNNQLLKVPETVEVKNSIEGTMVPNIQATIASKNEPFSETKLNSPKIEVLITTNSVIERAETSPDTGLHVEKLNTARLKDANNIGSNSAIAQ